MSYQIAFECGYPGCDETIGVLKSRLADAHQVIRAEGWTCRAGQHFCPKHG